MNKYKIGGRVKFKIDISNATNKNELGICVGRIKEIVAGFYIIQSDALNNYYVVDKEIIGIDQ